MRKVKDMDNEYLTKNQNKKVNMGEPLRKIVL